MSSRSGQSLSTLLLSLPLAAVAFMAVFGVPQFVPMVASGDDEELTRSSDRRSGRKRQLEQVFEEFSPDAPEFASQQDTPPKGSTPWWENSDASATPSPGRQQPAARHARFNTSSEDNTPPATEFASIPSRNPGSGVEPHLTDTSFTTPATDSPASGRALDWQTASRKLSELGVEKYHLERGHREGSFLFVCLFTSAANPHQVNRFEAEANDPLQAVNEVLGQIDQWLKQQYVAQDSPPFGLRR